MRYPPLHPSFRVTVEEIINDVADVEGWLSIRDIRFLAMVAAHPSADGEILEIGAFRGKSSIVLAKASELVGQQRIYSCDPLNCQLPPDHPTSIYERSQLDNNLIRKNVFDRVEFHQTFSHEFAKTWTLPIRMLWLDGDHHLAGVRQDLQDFMPFLADGAIVAMHDVLSTWDGVGRVFVENVLESPCFGHAGINGNIAWSQYRANPAATIRLQPQKKELADRLRPLIPIQTVAEGRSVRGFNKLRYRYLRWRAQPPIVSPETWVKQVA
jgi:hypothetical protein